MKIIVLAAAAMAIGGVSTAHAMSNEEYAGYFKCIKAVYQESYSSDLRGFKRLEGDVFIHTRISERGGVRKLQLHVFTPQGIRYLELDENEPKSIGVTVDTGQKDESGKPITKVVAKFSTTSADSNGRRSFTGYLKSTEHFDRASSGEVSVGGLADSILQGQVTRQVLDFEKRYNSEVEMAEFDTDAKVLEQAKAGKPWKRKGLEKKFDVHKKELRERYGNEVEPCSKVKNEKVQAVAARLRPSPLPEAAASAEAETPEHRSKASARGKKAAR